MKSHGARKAANTLSTREPPNDTKELRRALSEFLSVKLPDGRRLGSCKHGIYAFFDYDGEPIYVGQTSESLGTRVRRHLTNQRTDAVAMGVLDPFEVRRVRVWPLSPDAARNKPALNNLEATIFARLIRESKFGALLNEKNPSGRRVPEEKLPPYFDGDLVSVEIADARAHPDLRLARRASVIAKLAQIISERQVSPQLRRVLLAQANRLAWLAEKRLRAFAKSAG